MESLRILLLAILLLAHLEIKSLAAAQLAGVVEMKVKTVVIDPNAQSPVVVLEGVAAKEFLPIWIDIPEARAISLEIEQVKTPRPLTHDLFLTLFGRLKVSVTKVVITDLRNHTYYATVYLTAGGTPMEIDSRPSDAIALAIRAKVPVFAEERVFEKSERVPGGPSGPGDRI